MSEFKVGGTCICTNAKFTHYKIFYSNTILYRLTWGYNTAKKIQNKTKPNKSHNLRKKVNSDILMIIIIGCLLRDKYALLQSLYNINRYTLYYIIIIII